MKNVFLYFIPDTTVSGIINGLIEKAIITIIFAVILFAIKPIRIRVIKWFKKMFKKITGREKHSVIVTGYVFKKGQYNNKDLYFNFEIELPYRDISEDVMPISESTALILKEVNHKYHKDFYPSGYDLNKVVVKKKVV